MARHENGRMKKSEHDQVDGFLRGRRNQNNRTGEMDDMYATDDFEMNEGDDSSEEENQRRHEEMMSLDDLPDDPELGTRLYDEIAGISVGGKHHSLKSKLLILRNQTLSFLIKN